MPFALFAVVEVLVGANRKTTEKSESARMERRGWCVCASRHLYDVSIMEMITLWNPLVFVHFASSGDEGL